MTDDVKQEPLPKPKQYLVMVDEMGMAFLSKLVPSLQFCLVEGVAIPNNPNYYLLANPTPQLPKEE